MSTKAKENKPEPPKRPLSAYMMYNQQVFKDLQKQYPNKKVTEITKLVSEKYQQLSAKDKEKLNQKVEEEKAAYKKKIEDYEKKHGPIEKKSRKKSGDSKKPKAAASAAAGGKKKEKKK